LVELAQRDVQTLSGGERQRVALAAVTAQQPQIYLLDEPLNNLDPRHQLATMQAMRSRCDDGAAVLAVIHDLNLVARFADRVLMLFGPAADAAWYAGATATAMTADRLSKLYRTPIRVHAVSDGTVFTAI
ncbi:MAG: ATP-binding cassette domain-containing protein, partial [Gammaproteobacteria bacterium]|nr:ATP-binding cassette domain-containing protein [Gammaproteobacteria bacterium]